MRLTTPTDFDILEALSDGKRNNAANISRELDRNRSYINTRMPVLADYGLLTHVGPAERSGIYAITAKGRRALENREAYRDDQARFEEAVGGAATAEVRAD